MSLKDLPLVKTNAAIWLLQPYKWRLIFRRLSNLSLLMAAMWCLWKSVCQSGRGREKNKTKGLPYNQRQSVIWTLSCQRSSENPFTLQLLRGGTRLVHFMKLLLLSVYNVVDCLQICDTSGSLFFYFHLETSEVLHSKIPVKPHW